MRPLLLGHRGARASRRIPENTLASFELCLQHGCDGFEFDVRRSGDGTAVVCHDAAIRGLTVGDAAAEVLALPRLDDVLARFSLRAFLDIELKVAGLEAQVIAALREGAPSKGYVVSSFLPEALRAVHRLDPGIPLGFLFDQRDQVPPPDLPIAWLIPHFEVADQRMIEGAHASGIKVMTWTVNGAEGIRQFAEWGVDAIISDETELLVRSTR